MEFLVFDFPLSSSLASIAGGLAVLLLLVAGGLYLGARADRERILAQRPESLRKAA